MLLVVYILFLLLSAFILANRQGKKLVETIPVIFSLFVLLLYILAFFNRMWLIDYAALLGLIFSVYLLYKKKMLQELIRQLREPSFLIFAVVVVLGMILLSARGIVTHDDWSFWMVDIKSLYCLEGYAAKGFNCSPQYGDYPPAMQLVAVWLMHSLGKFQEGYAYSAYFLIMQVYMAPLLVKVPRNPVVCLGAVVWMFVIFSYGPDILLSLSPDFLMGLVYGCALLFIFSRGKESFEQFDIAAVLSVLVLMKSIGFQWALFALAFMITQRVLQKQKLQIKSALYMLIPTCAGVSWCAFCRIYKRTTYLTAGWIEGMQTLSYFDLEIFKTYKKTLLISYFKALFRKQQTGIFLNIGLSIAFCFFAFIVVILVFRKLQLLQPAESKWLLGFTVFVGILEYAILLFSVETMFIGEYRNYIEVDHMVELIKRYSSPYNVGTTMLLLHILFQRMESLLQRNGQDSVKIRRMVCSAWLCVIAVSIAVSPVDGLWQRYVSYRNYESNLERSMVERLSNQPCTIKLIEAVNTAREYENQKVLAMMYDNIPMATEYSYYSVPIPVVLVPSDERVYQWYDFLLYYGCTAVCFVTDGENEEWLKGIETVNGKTVVPYQIYYPDQSGGLTA